MTKAGLRSGIISMNLPKQSWDVAKSAKESANPISMVPHGSEDSKKKKKKAHLKFLNIKTTKYRESYRRS